MYYPIQLDKSRNFKYGMKALSLIEKRLKKPFAKISLDDLTVEEIAVFIWAGLVHEDNTLTPEKVMDLVDEYSNFTTVSEIMGRALSVAMGAGEDTDEKNAQETASSA